MKKTVLILCILCFTKEMRAQGGPDKLSLEKLFQIVRTYHPVALQSALLKNKAEASLLEARGGFDPVAAVGAQEKTFDAVTYFQNNNVQVSIPTWYGIEIKTGIEYLYGGRTNPTETLGKTSFAGISIPVAKNLLMDKRRAALQKAKIMVQASEVEQREMLNNLFMDVSDAYWDWVKATYVVKSYDEFITLSKKRASLVKTAVVTGEAAAIDSTEAIAQYQQFEYLRIEALMNLQKSTAELNNFLWKENTEPYELPETVVPENEIADLFDAVMFPELDALIETALNEHPQLRSYFFKLQSLEVEKKLQFQEFLPQLDLQYNQLGKGYDLAKTAGQTLFDNNYKYGLRFSIPLRLSRGRGAYRLARLNLRETRLQQSNKATVITNKVRNYYNQLVLYKDQVNLLQKTYSDFRRLQRAEETRFFNGESSLFLVNSRETKALETYIKLTEVAVNYNRTNNRLYWAAGTLWQN